MAECNAVEWLRIMERNSIPTDYEPHFARIADELEQLRAEVAALHEALVAGHRLAA